MVMSGLFKVIFFLSVINLTFSVDELLPAGLFSIRLIGVEKCPGVESNEQDFALHLQRQNNKKTYLVGNITFKVPMDDKLRAEYIFDKWGTGKWNENSYVHAVDNISCESIMRFLGPVFKEFLYKCVEGECLKRKKSDPVCPIYTGRYEITDFDSTGLNKLKIPAAIAGKWRFSLKTVNRKSNKVVGCLRIIALAEPKRI